MFGQYIGGNTINNSFGSNTSSFSNKTGNNSTLPTSVSTNSTKVLKDLLASANNLPKGSNLELGSIHLTLNELQRKSQQLRKAENNDVNFTKAHYLLASSGISAEDIESELNSIKVLDNEVKSNKLVTGGNLENYLSYKKDENILNSIEQSLNLAARDFDSFINSNIKIDWKIRRDELRRSIGLKHANNDDENIKNSISWNRSISGNYNILSPLGNKVSNSAKQLTREKFENYAKVVYELNESRLSDSFFPLFMNFEELNKLSNNLKSKQISEVYRILIDLTNEKFTKTNQEQKFHQEYKANTLNRKIVNNSKSYLEQQFYIYVDEIYTKDDTKVNFLSPTNINKISYFIDKIIMKNNRNLENTTLNVNGTPIWALIFYLLRSGLYNEALDVIERNKDLFEKFDKNFPVYFKKFVESDSSILPVNLSERLHQEFNQQFSFINENEENYDPFKYSVYKIVGKCDLSKKKLPQSINLSIEDWLWFHLSIINEDQFVESNLIFENYTLANLQKKVLSLGPKQFNSSSNNPLYLKTLVLIGLYELAAQYAYEVINDCDAVHLAIGLNYYGLLKVSSFNNNDELIHLNNYDYEINFTRLVGSYTRTFKLSDPKVAVQYLILIALSKGGDCKEEISKCHEAIRELILVSREFNILLGELSPLTGEKIPGILEKQRTLIKLPDLNDFYHHIIEISAMKCEEEGRIFDALLLYQSCMEFDTVVSLINKLLGEILSTTELDKSLIQSGNYENLEGEPQPVDTIENNIILLSQHIMQMVNNNSYLLNKVSSLARETSAILLPIVKIRELFIKKEWQNVLNELRKLNLLPLDVDNNLVQIRKFSELIKNNILDDSLVKVIPSLLVIVMTSISQLNYLTLTRRYLTPAHERNELQNIKIIAKNCMIYAGMVQYKMPRETYSLLINLEALL